MYDRLLALWQQGRITQASLDTAVSRGWITLEQEQTILAAPVPA